jgi:hypothetical protein
MLRSRFFWNSEQEDVDPEIRDLINGIHECAEKILLDQRERRRRLKPKGAVRECIGRYVREGYVLVPDPDGDPVDPCGRVLWFKDCKDSTLIWALRIVAMCTKYGRKPPKAMIFETDKWNMKMEESFERASVVGKVLGVRTMTVFPLFGLRT